MSSRKVHCEYHGSAEWLGHVICERCKLVYHIESAPSVCEACGSRLMPDGDRSEFTARTICARCAEQLGGRSDRQLNGHCINQPEGQRGHT